MSNLWSEFWEQQHYKWIFDGLGIAIIGSICTLVWRRWSRQQGDSSPSQANIQFSDPVTKAKSMVKILFIDDLKFKVVDILRDAGWVHTKRVRDVPSLDDPDVVATDIFFVDIQGVGKLLGFKDEGLGLAEALKTKYPEKKVIIYSGQRDGDRFHKALKTADDTLAKNADPYEFQQLVEQYGLQICEQS
jgi:hypothetical protein